MVQVCPHVETFGHAPYELVRQLQAEVLDRLARAEVPAVAPDECSKTVGEGFLWINLRASPSTSGDVYAYVVDVELAQDARLIRDPKTVIEAVTTWRVLKLGVARPAELDGALGDLALELVDVFIKIYKEKN